MSKRQLTLYVDTDLISFAKAKNINLSELFENTLQSIMNMPEQISNLDEQTINNDIITTTEKLNELKALKEALPQLKDNEMLKKLGINPKKLHGEITEVKLEGE